MSQEKKTKLSDVARQNNAAKAARFSATMIPAPPPTKSQAPPVEPALMLVATEEPVGVGEEGGSLLAPVAIEADPVQLADVDVATDEPVATPTKPARARRSSGLSMEDVIGPEPPKGEPYARQVRISETHHRLLRKLAFHHDKTMNHVLYNLLEQLDQADQRNQQKGD